VDVVKIEGGCHCGAVRYVFDGEPLFAGFCHCEACRKTSGSVGSPAFGVNVADIKVTGEMHRYTIVGGSGKNAHRDRCAKCGSLLYGLTDTWPDIMTLYAGTFDDPGQYAPVFAIFTRARPEWAKFAVELIEHEAAFPD
jgi:hypothetical protein